MVILKAIWRWWRPVARKIGNWQARIFLMLFYFLFISPVAITIKLFSDPLNLKKQNNPSFWIKRSRKQQNLDQAKEQY